VKLNVTPRASIKDPDLQRELREHATQVNMLTEGKMSAKYSALTAPPSTGAYDLGDYIPNKTPSIVGTAPNRYIVNGWRCVTAGDPATFVECKELIDPPLNDPAVPTPIPAAVYFGAPMMMLPDAGVYISNGLNGTLGTQASAANRQDIAPFLAGYDFDIDQVAISVSTGLAGNAAVLIFDSDANGRPTTVLMQSPNISTATAATVTASVTFSFEAGRLYWIGVWTSSASTLRVFANTSAFTQTWTTAATPVQQAILRRTETYGTATNWTYASGQHTSALAPLVLMRIA
jgi:hypothetical protein